MMQLAIKTIAQAIGAPLPPGDCETIVTRINTDSRTVGPGDCFFALPGENFDGHEYVAQAFTKGACCAVVSHAIETDGPLLKTDDTIRALGDLARTYRQSHSFKVVAITGSVGKTTTRQITYHALSRHFQAHQAQKNFNNTIGLPLTLLDADPDNEVIVAELGANKLGEIAYLTDIARPDVAVVTNAHPAHLAGFGSIETIIREKTSIAQGLPPDGMLLLNGDIEALVAACRALGRPFKTFGRSANCDYRAEAIEYDGLASSFTIGGQRIALPLPGPGNVDNALAAWAVCEQFGLTLAQFAEAVADLPRVSMRAEPVQVGSLTILNDCYNASPASMNNALAILSHLRNQTETERNRRLVFVCGVMAELGEQTEMLHAELGRAVAQAGVDVLLTVGDATQTTAETARNTATRALQTEHFNDVASLCDNLEHFINEHDIILVKGSRTARLENVLHELIKDYG